MGRSRQFVAYWLPVLLWMTFIFIGSTDIGSGQRTSHIIGPILRWFIPGISDDAVSGVQFAARKVAHLMVYATLAILIWRARQKPSINTAPDWSSREILLIVTVATVYAITDEFHQSFVSSRLGSPIDVLIDAIGAWVGLVFRRKCWMWRSSLANGRVEPSGRAPG